MEFNPILSKIVMVYNLTHSFRHPQGSAETGGGDWFLMDEKPRLNSED